MRKKKDGVYNYTSHTQISSVEQSKHDNDHVDKKKKKKKLKE